jgi:hypothetical protein
MRLLQNKRLAARRAIPEPILARAEKRSGQMESVRKLVAMPDKLLCNLLINRQTTRAQAKGDNRTAIVRFERAAVLQAALPTPSDHIGTIRSGGLLPRPCCRLAVTPRRSRGYSVRQPSTIQWLVVLPTGES